MSLITVTNLSKSFGPVDLFASVSFAVPKGSRLALVVPNGCGKTIKAKNRNVSAKLQNGNRRY
ncbi:MAG: hypothetical protein ABIF04_05565 [Chloroflexota bacterium]